MREGPRTVKWRNEEFRFENLVGKGAWDDASPVWAVSRHGEFIGTMPRASEETTKEFELRSMCWLADLIR
jgi:hypothetical protein